MPALFLLIPTATTLPAFLYHHQPAQAYSTTFCCCSMRFSFASRVGCYRLLLPPFCVLVLPGGSYGGVHWLLHHRAAPFTLLPRSTLLPFSLRLVSVVLPDSARIAYLPLLPFTTVPAVVRFQRERLARHVDSTTALPPPRALFSACC